MGKLIEEVIKAEFEKIRKDVERIMTENYELAQEVKKLRFQLNEHIKTSGILTH